MTDKIEVLIVEDSDLMIERLNDLFSDFPEYQLVGFAKTAADGIKKFDEFNAPIAILDMKLEVGYGLEVLVHIRNISKKCLIIVLTNYSSPSIKRECLELGANYFLDKSFDFDSIIDICEENKLLLI